MNLRWLVAATLGAAAFVESRTQAAERTHRIRGRFIDVDGARLHWSEVKAHPWCSSMASAR